MVAATTERALAEARMTFHSGVYGGIGGATIAHLVAPLLMSDELFRLVLVIAFFGCLATAAWSFTTPYEAYMRARMAWRYAEAGDALRYNADLYVARLSGYAAALGWVATAAVGLCLFYVLSFWPMGEMLTPLRPVLKWSFIGTAVAIPLVAIGQSRRLREAVEMRRAISEQEAASGFRPRTAESAAASRRAAARPPVEVTEALGFAAGGYTWGWQDFYKNTAVFGQSGSGKTVCVLNALLDGLLASAAAAGTPPAGLILDPKGDFRTKIGTLMVRNGWQDRLATIDPTNPDRSIRWNPLDSSDKAMELAGRFAGVLGTLSESSDKDKYFIDTATTFLQHMIVILRTTHPDRPPSLSEVYECATSDDRLGPFVRDLPKGVGIEVERAAEFMRQEWRGLAQDTKSIVRSFVSNMLGPFVSPPYDTLFAGRSTVSLSDAVEEGRIVYVHLPLAEAEVMARVVATFVKLEFYREVLRRPDKARPSFFLCDEFQAFFTVGGGRGDADAFERTRQSNHANIVAFQNLNALYKQTDRKEPVDNLLGNCATQIFLRNTDRATNEYASKLFGEHVETLLSVGSSFGANARKGASSNVGGSTQYGARVREASFAQLAVPSKADAVDYAESMTHLGARARVTSERQRWRVHPIV
ncbi:MAG: type IV secretion system DNA-binding domain-containing protein [Pseudomonadota bacterium]